MFVCVHDNIDVVLGLSVRIYGSCNTGFALNDSNVNLELLYSKDMNHFDAFDSARQYISKCDGIEIIQ